MFIVKIVNSYFLRETDFFRMSFICMPSDSRRMFQFVFNHDQDIPLEYLNDYLYTLVGFAELFLALQVCEIVY